MTLLYLILVNTATLGCPKVAGLSGDRFKRINIDSCLLMNAVRTLCANRPQSRSTWPWPRPSPGSFPTAWGRISSSKPRTAALFWTKFTTAIAKSLKPAGFAREPHRPAYNAIGRAARSRRNCRSWRTAPRLSFPGGFQRLHHLWIGEFVCYTPNNSKRWKPSMTLLRWIGLMML